MRLPLRRKYLRARLAPLYLLALALFLLADPSPASLALGALLVSGGLALRAWGAGHLVKTDRLTTTGPYAYLRHPLYSGTLLVGTGLAAAAGPVGWALLLGALLPFFFFYYAPYKERIESARLERRYGEAYAAYRMAVPALWPARRPWRRGVSERGAGGEGARDRAGGPGIGRPLANDEERAEGWSVARYLANDEQGALVASLLGLALLVARPVVSC